MNDFQKLVLVINLQKIYVTHAIKEFTVTIVYPKALNCSLMCFSENCTLPRLGALNIRYGWTRNEFVSRRREYPYKQ